MTVMGYPEAIEPPTELIVYVCPTKTCRNYFASPDFRPDRSDLDTPQIKRSQNTGAKEVTHTRKECPSCRLQGKKVDRVPYIVTQVVPLDEVLKRRKSN